ncbi:hypothetical protein ACEYYB_00495 [Paracoccus sp. p4-l81]
MTRLVPGYPLTCSFSDPPNPMGCRLVQGMLDRVGPENHVEMLWLKVDPVQVASLFRELDDMIGDNRVDRIWHGREDAL